MTRCQNLPRARFCSLVALGGLLAGCYGAIGDPATSGASSDASGVATIDGGGMDGTIAVDTGSPDASRPDAGPDDIGPGDAGHDAGELMPPGRPECNDGLDNDGDGVVDWQFDLGCWGPADGTEGGLNNELDNGWTVFEPSPNTRIVHVSNSTGDDAWSGLAPEFDGTDGPKKTVAAGIAQLRDGSPDWLLFKRGDTWLNQPLGNWPISGPSAEAPAIIASYGSSTQRPHFEVTRNWMITISAGGVSPARRHVRIMGLHVSIYTRDPSDPRFNGVGEACLSWQHEGGDILFEDFKCEFGAFYLQGNPSLPITIRRSIITDSYALHSHAQSMFAAVQAPLILEENIFNHGGWSEAFKFSMWRSESDPLVWAAINDGRVTIELDGRTEDLNGLDFSGVRLMSDVAGVFENAINGIYGANTVTLRFSQGGAFILRAPSLRANGDYQILAYAGGVAGTDLEPLLIRPEPSGGKPAQGTPNSTIFNRNLYLAVGEGRTVVRGNIDANGSSGGTQIRMGGIYENNLSLRNPIGVVFGNAENPGGSTVGGLIANNVLLGARDISTQPQGRGIEIVSVADVDWEVGASTIRDLEISGNIVAFNVLGSANLSAILLHGDAPHRNVDIHHNLIYDWGRAWEDPMAQASAGIGIFTPVPSANISVHDNAIQQVNGGFVLASQSGVSGLTLTANTYYSAAPNPPDIWSRGWYQFGRSVSQDDWRAGTGESSSVEARINYVDPDRSVESYMLSLGLVGTYEAFIEGAVTNSKHEWHPEFLAASVNDYIRAGFELDTSE